MAYHRSAAPIKTCAAEIKETIVKIAKASEDQYESQNYLFPSGVVGSKIIMAGVITEKEQIDDSSIRMRIADSTGSISIYAGQYQPEIMQASRSIDIPSHVSIVGKMSTYEGNEGQIYVSIKPTSITVIDPETRNDFIVDIADAMISRISKMSISPEDPTVKMAASNYPGITPKSLLEMVETSIHSLDPITQEDSTPVQPPEKTPEPPDARGDHRRGQPRSEEKPEKKPVDKKKKADPKKEPDKPGSSKIKTLDTSDLADKINTILTIYGKLSIVGLINYLKDAEISTETAGMEAALSMLMKQGMIYEPKPGYFEATK